MNTFVVAQTQLENRLDPEPYHPDRQNALARIKSSRFPVKPLKEVVSFRRSLVSTKTDDAPYLGLENIESNTGEYLESEKVKEEFGSAFRFANGDVLFPKLRPYLNKVHRARFDGYCSTEMHVLEPKEVNPDYLTAFLSSEVVVKQTAHLMTGNTLPRLQTNEIEDLLVPVPDLQVQKKIQAILSETYQHKQQLEQEAEDLLSTFSDFVSKTLGIDIERQNLRKAFVLNFNDLKGILSANHYAANSFNTSAYRPLHELAKINPTRRNQLPALVNDSQVPYVGLPETGNSAVNEILYRPYREVRGRNIIAVGDILFARIEPSIFNKKYIFVDDLKGNDYAFTSTEFYVVEAKELVNPKYLFAMLFSPTVYNQVAGKTTGSTGRRRLDSRVFGEILIPFPSRDIQDAIANEYDNRTARAQQLKTEANNLLATAQNHIQSIILGNHGIQA